jgi:hypothetical protein
MRAAIVGVVFATAAFGLASAAEMKSHSFSLPGHGTLALQAPASWNDSVSEPPKGLPQSSFTFTFTPKSGAQFQVIVTAIWAGPDYETPTLNELRIRTRQAANEIAPQSVEKTLELKPLGGATQIGYYFAATDPKPKPGEFKYLNQGIIGIGDLRIAFTILTNDGQGDVVRAALAMISGAEHR